MYVLSRPECLITIVSLLIHFSSFFSVCFALFASMFFALYWGASAKAEAAGTMSAADATTATDFYTNFSIVISPWCYKLSLDYINTDKD